MHRDVGKVGTGFNVVLRSNDEPEASATDTGHAVAYA